MTRFFTFGCSFTNYWWPTWADILGKQYKKFYNYGYSGAGNQYIFNSIVEANLKHKFNHSDTVAIMWSNPAREDRYVNNKWVTVGNIYTQCVYDQKFVKKFADIRGYFIRDLATIWAIDCLLKSIGCNVIHFSIFNLTDTNRQYKNYNVNLDDLLEFYNPVLEKILPSFYNVIFNCDFESRPRNIAEETTDAIKKIIFRRIFFQNWYQDIKDVSWPECNYEEDFENLSQDIQTECKNNFNYNPFSYKLSPPSRKTALSPVIFDNHPTPLEHLEYLETVCPELEIYKETKSWVKKIDNMLHEYQDYTKIWLPNTQTRW